MAVTLYPNYIWFAGFASTAEPSITTQNYACSGGETTGPAYDLLDNNNNNVITIDTFEETTDFVVDIDLTAAITGANFAIVDNHNFGTAGGEIKITYSTTTQAIASAYSGTLGSALGVITVTSNEIIQPTDGILLANFTGTRTSQNWEVDIEHDGVVLGQFNADVTMGEVAIGVKCAISVSPDANMPYDIEYGNELSMTRSGQKHSTQLYGKKRAWTLSWNVLQTADLTNLITAYNVCNGTHRPFWIDLGEAATLQLYFVRFTGALRYTKLMVGAYAVSFSVEEEL